MMVDYREREERLREKRKMFPHYITAGPPQREELLREILIIIFRRGVFTNFIKQNYSERRKTERKKFVNVSPLHYRPTTERGKFLLEKF